MQNYSAKLKIIIGQDNSTLRVKAKKIAVVTSEIQGLIEKMAQKMKEAEGIGLAAPQIGKSIQLFVVDSLAFDRERSKWEFKKITPPDVTKPLVFINPVISSYPKGQDAFIEGCLSLPGFEGKVSRSKRITIKAQLVSGETFKLQAKGLLARVLQHEYDHLQGTLICDKWEKEMKVKSSSATADKVKKIVFFGDSEYSQIVLNKLKVTAYEPEIIIGKNTKYQMPDTKYLVGITASYGEIIPRETIDKFKYGILNIHPSLLPRYRGPSPLQAAILNGDSKTGVSIIQLSEKMDAGPLVAQGEFMVDELYTSQTLGEILFKEGALMLLDVLPEYLARKLTPVAQDETKASYTALIEKKDGLIDWSQDAQIIERKIRAFIPWPVAYTYMNHRGAIRRLQIMEADIIKNLTIKKAPGNLETASQELLVHTGKGILRITKLRPEGKREMSGEEFMRGYDVETFSSKSK